MSFFHACTATWMALVAVAIGLVALAFRADDWPDPTPEVKLWPILLVAGVIALPVAVGILSFPFTLGSLR